MGTFSRFFWIIVLALLTAGTVGGLFLWPALSKLLTR